MFNPKPLKYFLTLDYSDCYFTAVTKRCLTLGVAEHFWFIYLLGRTIAGHRHPL